MTRELQSSIVSAAYGRRLRRRSAMLILCAGALLTSGCAFRQRAANMAIEHNDFVAQTTNRQTVLNILRAREREPMHFTSFANVAGKVQGQGQVGLNVTLNGDNGQTVTTDFEKSTRDVNDAFRVGETTRQVATTLARGATNFAPSGQVSVTTGTDFQIAVNASEEFYRGILGPLSPGIVVHYLRQGFPPDLLSHLVIRRLEFRVNAVNSADKTVASLPLDTFVNSPDDAEAVEKFADILKCWQLGTVMKDTAAVRVPAPRVTDLTGVNVDALSRIKRVKDDDGVHRYYLEISPARTEPTLALVEPGSPACDARAAFEAKVAAWGQSEAIKAVAIAARRDVAAAGAVSSPASGFSEAAQDGKVLATTVAPAFVGGEQPISQGVGPSGVERLQSVDKGLTGLLPNSLKAVIEIDMTLRSVEGILYYLGEYIRNESQSPKLRKSDGGCKDGSQGYCLPIIRVLPASRVRNSDRFIDVIYRGDRWAVPLAGGRLTEENGRSSQTISLVQQLLNLHRSSKDLPFTPLVRVQN